MVSKHPDYLIEFISVISAVKYESLCSSEFLAAVKRAPAPIMESPTMEMVIVTLWHHCVFRLFLIDLVVLTIYYFFFVYIVEGFILDHSWDDDDNTGHGADFWFFMANSVGITSFYFVKEARIVYQKDSVLMHFADPWSPTHAHSQLPSSTHVHTHIFSLTAQERH